MQKKQFYVRNLFKLFSIFLIYVQRIYDTAFSVFYCRNEKCQKIIVKNLLNIQLFLQSKPFENSIKPKNTMKKNVFSHCFFALMLLFLVTACEMQDAGTVPNADFVIEGNIKSAITLQPIEGIRVVLLWDTTYTNALGFYQVKFNTFPENQSVLLQVEDIDGGLNGLFLDTDTTIQLESSSFTNGDGNAYYGIKFVEVPIFLHKQSETN